MGTGYREQVEAPGRTGGFEGGGAGTQHLAIRRERSPGRLARDLRAFVPVQPQPVEAIEDVLLVCDRATGLIGVLEAEDEGAARVPGIQVVEQCRSRRPDVERTSRAR